MTVDQNALTCHRCDKVKGGQHEQWWHLTKYKGLFSGLVCPNCMDRLSALTDEQVTALQVALALAPEKSSQVSSGALKSKF